uniref:Phytanoyl-CoA dioxygenase n=1 Tax=Tetradesmus obliquus TaxID=3088 RepID=A0A383WPX7_TETOB|eukprot:jgi/Sobl393_1/6419/SZX79520.1
MPCLGLGCFGLGVRGLRRATPASTSHNVQHTQAVAKAQVQHVAASLQVGRGRSTHTPLSASKAAETASTQQPTSPLLTSLDSSLSSAVAAAAEHLAEHGWAVVPGVLSKEECQQYEQGVWGWLGRLSGGSIRRDEPSTWTEACGWPPAYKGIVNTLEVAHQDFVWRVRKHPRLLQVFAELYGTSELLSSFDSINLMPPGTDASGGWLHVDHAPLKKGCQCIQGLVNMVDVGPESTGTLLVKDKSHLLLEEFYERHTLLTAQQKAETGDWYVFQEAELPHWQQLPSLGLSGAAGDLFLWDSRTAHQNIGPAATTAWRHVVYACYQPRCLATEKDLQLKQQAWDDFLLTTHWPSHNIRAFPGLGKSATYYASAGADEQQGSAEPLEPVAAAATAAGSASSAAAGTAASEEAGAAAEQQQQSYWKARAADGSTQVLLASIRTRHLVEDAALRKLAGVQLYEAAEVWSKQPLLEWYDHNPGHSCTQPQAAR